MSNNDDAVPVGISLPRAMINKIDVRRKDVSRSRYVKRALEGAFAAEDQQRMRQFEE